MKLEISIKANIQLRQFLLASLAELATGYHIKKDTIRNNGGNFELNFLIETESPDFFLKDLADIIAATESSMSHTQDIDVYVKNFEDSEPSYCPEKNGIYFSPVEGIRVVPWLETATPSEPAEHDILLNPAGAFGNGLHPSTRLCLQLLKQAVDHHTERKFSSSSVLDIGCGSGILTIAALRLGASSALSVELDKQAAQTARRNIEINQLTDSVIILETSWQKVTGQYDLLFANLVPSVLVKAAPYMAKFLSRHGLLITAGFPATNNTKILNLFTENGLRLIADSSVDGWGALLLGNQL
ncbi:MAG: 50S ribosomal protein L11 methyltransferase [Deltaproteobacteria bacterium]|jgi:ribosomal protein L11 methyltransferase|nr:50S ribosomal protein L11 methyltransferase [Deltaproteobacteria bacterium]